MELPLPHEFKLDSTSLEMMSDVAQTARQINELRPLPSDLVSAIQRELLGERVYSSNAIEGNTLSLGETREILATGHIEPGTRKREATEVVNLGKAIEFARSLIPSPQQPFTFENFFEAHRLLMTGINDGIAGVFRPGRVQILGAKYQPPSEQQVPDLVEKMLGTIVQAQGSEPMLQATWAHWAIARIHPFVDGNGRIARLWQDVILFRRGLTCAVISPELREEYLRALGTADGGDLNPLLQLLAQRVATTFDRYIIAQKKTDSISDWARNIAGELAARADEQRKLLYLRWQRKMEELRYEFQRCAAAVTEAGMDIDIQMRDYPMLEQTAWENIRSGARATGNWFFILSFRRHSLHWSYIFFFGKHFRASAEHLDESVPAVNLLVAEQEGFGSSERLDDLTDSPITFREVFLDRDQFILVRSGPPSQDRKTYDTMGDASQIARQFLEEVVLKRLS